MRLLPVTMVSILVLGCAAHGRPASPPPKPSATVEDARGFLQEVDQGLLERWVAAERASWVKATYITHDTEIIAARAQEEVMAYTAEAAADAVRFDGLDLPRDMARQLALLKLSLDLPAPRDPSARAELAALASDLASAYSKGRYCDGKGRCRPLSELTRVMATSRDPKELLDVWVGWRKIARPMRPEFRRFVSLANQGARELGFADLGALWRSRYDMPPEAFEAEVHRLWAQVRPLYEALHCYVRARLHETYGIPDSGPIPAHLLGNMWAQSWDNLYDMVAPEPGRRGIDLTAALARHHVTPVQMVRYAEGFFVSLGLDPLPDTFWERSMFTRPRDREVVCHASAWDIDWKDDLRIKMCIQVTGEDFTTIHHELGHNYYQRSYAHLPALFTNSANDGFHEALGDTIALSVTPEYLVKIGLIDEAPADSLDALMRRALDKVAFLPFGLLVDEWRWKVFSGEVPPERYEQAWWDLRTKYQGVVAPVPRTEEDFDPGAKYHIPANVPYARYFLATILQFQFHRALCRVAGFDGPLDRCSIYGNHAAGQRLLEMMRMGMSRPWPDALEALTGERDMDATAMVQYFEPLMRWLEEHNRGHNCGW